MTRQTLLLEDFTGGLDLSSSLNTVPVNCTPNALNVRIAPTGGWEKILGYSAHATLGAAAHDMGYFEHRDGSNKFLVAAESTAWQSVNAAGTVANVRTGMAANTDTQFVNYGDAIYGLDPQNIMASWTGAALTTYATGVTTGPPLGIILGIWSNRMYVATATAGAIGMTVVWSDPADFTKWPVANSVNLGGVGTSDRIVGGAVIADGIVVFTNRTTFRIYDSLTGANTCIDTERGCTSRRSLSTIDGKIYGINNEGVFVTDGNFPLQIISRNVDPLFINENPDVTDAAGTAWFGSYLNSFRRQGATTNNLTLDFAPTGAVMANQYPAKAWADGQLAGNDRRLYFIDASDNTQVRRAFSGGSFAGAAIPCYYETAFINLGVEQQLKRLHQMRLVGRGDMYVSVRKDYEALPDDTGRLSFPTLTGTGLWDTAVWDTALWNDYALFEGFTNVQVRARRMAFRFYETSTNTAIPRPIFDVTQVDGTTQLGGAAVYLIEPKFSVSSRNR